MFGLLVEQTVEAAWKEFRDRRGGVQVAGFNNGEMTACVVTFFFFFNKYGLILLRGN